ncbi:hypothetical protein SY85_16520 [Flavisolibacter tropicus]|uniref:Uncharacterized protein n=1 Tax=Flavisolibacter tropicus TaxID=1492898 RepID=A0A172TYN9_9BACT|nr:hypothetical protein SY85_16520 [Flavisolibacter tropicus]
MFNAQLSMFKVQVKKGLTLQGQFCIFRLFSLRRFQSFLLYFSLLFLWVYCGERMTTYGAGTGEVGAEGSAEIGPRYG